MARLGRSYIFWKNFNPHFIAGAVTPKISTLVDAFNLTSLQTSLWTQATGGSATISYTTGGATVNFPSVCSSSTVGSVTSNIVYDLTASSIYLQVESTASSGTAADSEIRLYIDTNNWIRWVEEAGTLLAQQMVSSTRTNVGTLTYSSTTHKYWRIREASGTTYWDTSADGSTWTNRFSTADPITETKLYVYIAGSCYEAEVSPGTFEWNNVNIAGQMYTVSSGDTWNASDISNKSSNFQLSDIWNSADKVNNSTGTILIDTWNGSDTLQRSMSELFVDTWNYTDSVTYLHLIKNSGAAFLHRFTGSW